MTTKIELATVPLDLVNGKWSNPLAPEMEELLNDGLDEAINANVSSRLEMLNPDLAVVEATVERFPEVKVVRVDDPLSLPPSPEGVDD